MSRKLPLELGQRFGRWKITTIEPVHDGAVLVSVKGADDHEFELEILARDTSPLAPRPPASTEALSIFVRNGGDGSVATAEEQGLAAMALADAITASGPRGAVAGLLTYSERFARHHQTLTGEEYPAMVHLV